MRVKRLLFLAALFFLLLAYVLIAEQGKQEEESEPAEDLVKVFSIAQEQISEIEITYGNTTASLTHKGDGWQAANLQGEDPGQELVQSLVDSIIDVVKIVVVEQNPTDLAQFGLQNPKTTVTLFLKNKTPPVRLLMGNDCPTGVSLYAMVEGEGVVIQVGSYLRFSIRTFFEDSKKK